MVESKRIVWVLNRLITVGGGEKLLLEGVEFYRNIGFDVHIITWEFEEKSLFEGKYENKNIINLNEKIKSRENIFQRAISRLGSILVFRRKLLELNPELIIVQGEYDVATIYITTLFTNLKYAFLIFGQIFQYPHDLGKYSFIFRNHLKEIINSQQGYKETIPLKAPKTSLLNKLSNEVISAIRYLAVRKAVARFTFSNSVNWETKLLFGVDSIRNQGAFKESIFSEIHLKDYFSKYHGFDVNKKILLSFSRLDKKKRIDIILNSLKYLPQEYILVIAGMGECYDSLQDLAKINNLQSRVLFLGYIDEEMANSIKSSGDIFVSMDIGDFDISPLEALALGSKAIVATEFDLDENLSSIEGLITSEANEKVLANSVLSLYDKSLDLDFKSKLMKYTWENYFNKILKESKVYVN